jgi:hypothetical protein
MPASEGFGPSSGTTLTPESLLVVKSPRMLVHAVTAMLATTKHANALHRRRSFGEDEEGLGLENIEKVTGVYSPCARRRRHLCA